MSLGQFAVQRPNSLFFKSNHHNKFVAVWAQVYRSAPKEVQRCVWSCLHEWFSKELQAAIPRAKQSACSEQACRNRHCTSWTTWKIVVFFKLGLDTKPWCQYGDWYLPDRITTQILVPHFSARLYVWQVCGVWQRGCSDKSIKLMVNSAECVQFKLFVSY